MEIILENISYSYQKAEREALKDISLKIIEGGYYFIIGQNGSGKSTLLEMLAGLIKEDKGSYILKDIKAEEIGIVFQNPEVQFFQETVYSELAFALKHRKIEEQVIEEKIKRFISSFNMDFEKIRDLSPYELSGGEKRKIAIVTFLLLDPKVFILDEPTVALDPVSRTELLEILKKLQLEKGMTIIQSTHIMEEAVKYSNHVVVLNNGEIITQDNSREVFSKEEELRTINLGIPEISKLADIIRKKGVNLRNVISVDELKNNIMELVKIKNG